jgi:hypothetical protein
MHRLYFLVFEDDESSAAVFRICLIDLPRFILIFKKTPIILI